MIQKLEITIFLMVMEFGGSLLESKHPNEPLKMRSAVNHVSDFEPRCVFFILVAIPFPLALHVLNRKNTSSMPDKPRPSIPAAAAAPVVHVHALPPLGNASQPSFLQIPATSAVAAPPPAAHTLCPTRYMGR